MMNLQDQEMLDDSLNFDRTSSMRFVIPEPDLKKPIEVYSFGARGLIPQQQPIKHKRIMALGSGAQGDVFKVKLTTNQGEQVCVDKLKRIFGNVEMSKTVFNNMYREFSIGCTLNHPGIISYKYFIRQHSQQNGEKEQEFHIFMELMGCGNLEEYLSTKPLKREANIQNVRNIIRQLVKALAYLHGQNIVHQDLKPPNILFSKDQQTVKLCDFGVSNLVETTRITKAAGAGTTRYMPPEQLDE